MGIISYAQNYEDVILWRALGGLEDGFYLDVGANDPEELSVTKWFYDQGWHGINLEPSEEYYQLLCKARPRDVNLQKGAGERKCHQKYYEIPQTGLSTTDSEIAEGHKEKGFEVIEKEISIVPLAEVCEEYVGDREIHFLKIDVEGGEAAVLKGMDFHKFRPWVLVIEATLPLSTELSVDWDEMVRRNGYQFTMFDGLSYYYVAEEKSAELESKLSIPANVFDGFVQVDKVRLAEERDALKKEVQYLKGTHPVDCLIDPRFDFPWKAIQPGSRIIIYGGGVVGKTYLHQLLAVPYCKLIAICDRHPANTGVKEVPVITLAELAGLDASTYDTVLIAIEREEVAREIRNSLELAGLDVHKVKWLDPARNA